MEWEKPQLVDLNMVKYAGDCVVGDAYGKMFGCAPVGAGAESICEVGSSPLNQTR